MSSASRASALISVLLAWISISDSLLFNLKPQSAVPPPVVVPDSAAGGLGLAPVNTVVPSRGIIPYIGNTNKGSLVDRWSTHSSAFVPPTPRQQFYTRLNLWRQAPWRKIKGQVILKAKIGGAIELEPAGGGGFSFGAPPDLEPVNSLTEITTMLEYGAYDPRVKAVVLEIDRLACGYAKLQEVRRAMDVFRQSNKTIVAYCSAGAEKELYLALGADEIYFPPDGGWI
jgi:hypothetical protein